MLLHTYHIFLNGHIISEKKAKLELKKSTPILTFHGFGQSAHIFRQASIYRKNRLLICFNLLFHDTEQIHSYPSQYSVKHFNEEMKSFFQKFEIKDFSIIAFSIGARPAMAITSLFFKNLKDLTLIAPDGIYENRWFHFGTRTLLGKWVFYQLTKREQYIKKLILKAVSLSKGKSLLWQSALRTIEKNSLYKVYCTWQVYALFTCNATSLLASLFQQGKKVKVVLGRKDDIINYKKVKSRLAQIPSIIEIHPYHHEKILHVFLKEETPNK